MFPALLLRGLPVAEPSFTRRPGWSQPLESLWAILAKWQFVNCLPYATIARCMCAPLRAPAYEGLDLRVHGGFDLDALNQHSGVSRARLCAGVCSAAADSPVLAWTSTHLRFCPSCMRTGFHATLFQFTPICRCPIHNDRLIEACPACGGRTPYRLDAAFAANPLACPHCRRSLLPDPTALTRARQTPEDFDAIWRWQRLLAKYVCWYPISPCTRNDLSEPIDGTIGADRPRYPARPADRLAFIGVLQGVMREPPDMASMATRRTRLGSPAHRHLDLDVDPVQAPEFAGACWPGFETQSFIDLCHHYARFCHRRLAQADMRTHRVLHWWRRSWDGAIARPVTARIAFNHPPFGVAEWAAFRAPLFSDRTASADALLSRFDDDLQLTWDSWAGVLDQFDSSQLRGLHPRLVPPRSCWLDEPSIQSDAPALGYS